MSAQSSEIRYLEGLMMGILEMRSIRVDYFFYHCSRFGSAPPEIIQSESSALSVGKYR